MVSDPTPPPEAQRPAPRPPGTFRLGSIAGADVLVSASWFLIAILIAVLVSPRVEEVTPGLGILKYVAGLAFAVVLYGSVLLHEVSHAYVARHYGYPVHSITLHFLGGATAVQGEARRPKEEFWIAVVGPLTSVGVGLVALALLFVTPSGLLQLAVGGLVLANLFVGVLNLIPGLPLDGGRVLKACVWGITHDAHRGTVVAGWVGRGVAVLALLWPVALPWVLGVPADFFDYVLAAVVAIFLWTGATQAMASARFRSRLPHLEARRLARRTLAVPGDLPLGEAVRRAQEAAAGSIVTISSDGRPVGIVNESAVQAMPEERRPWVQTSSVTRTLGAGMALPVSLSGEALIVALSRTPAEEYLVFEDDGRLVGVLVTADVDAAYRAASR